MEEGSQVPVDNPQPTVETPPPTVQPQQSPPAEQAPKIKKPVNKKLLLLVGLVLVVGAAAAWFFLLRDKKTSEAPATNTTTTPTEETEETVLTAPKNVVYAFKAQAADQFQLYLRPASGGDRVDLKTQVSDDSYPFGDVLGSLVLAATDKDLWLSQDHGVTFEKVYTVVDTDDIIISSAISKDGLALVFTVNKNFEGNAGTSEVVINSVGLDGKNEKTLVTTAKTGAYILGVDISKERLVYQTGCYACDGPRDPAVVRNLKDGSEKQLYEAADYSVLATSVNNSISKLLYMSGTEDEAASTEGGCLGVCYGGPYTLTEVDVQTGTAKTLLTFGPDGYDLDEPYTILQVGYAQTANGPLPYFTNRSKQVSLVEDGKATVVYEAADPLLQVLYVSDTNVIALSGKPEDSTLNNFSVAAQQSTKILSGDNNTVLFGVTTE